MDQIPPELFLDGYSPPIRRIAERLRAIVGDTLPDAIEGVRLGWRIIGYDVPNVRRTTYMAWIAPEPRHVHLGFPHGVEMDDPDRVMRGEGITRRARWLTFTAPDQIDRAVLEPLLHEAVRTARLSRDERFARALARTS